MTTYTIILFGEWRRWNRITEFSWRIPLWFSSLKNRTSWEVVFYFFHRFWLDDNNGATSAVSWDKSLIFSRLMHITHSSTLHGSSTRETNSQARTGTGNSSPPVQSTTSTIGNQVFCKWSITTHTRDIWISLHLIREFEAHHALLFMGGSYETTLSTGEWSYLPLWDSIWLLQTKFSIKINEQCFTGEAERQWHSKGLNGLHVEPIYTL